MVYVPQLVTPPASEPLTLSEAKAHLRVDHNADNTLIESLITTARLSTETHTGRQLVTATYELAFGGFPGCGYLDLPLPPLQSVTSLTYYDTAGTPTVWGTSSYQVSTLGICGRIVPVYGTIWPTTILRPLDGLVVRFVAGYGPPNSVPQDIKAAMLLFIGHLYANREAVTGTGGVTVGPQVVPMGVEALLSSYWAKGF